MKIKELKELVKEQVKPQTSSVLLSSPSLLSESGLSRVRRHMLEHDCAIITAHRDDPTDTSLCVSSADDIDPTANNKIRNRDLKAVLLSKRFGVASVDGSYIENFDTPQAMEVSEASFFCVNLKDDPEFNNVVKDLGKKYCQDSVLIIPMEDGAPAYLYGTNNAEFPGLDQSIEVGSAKFGGDAEFMSKVGNRPFAFGENTAPILETYEDLSRNQRMAVKAIAKSFLNESRLKEMLERYKAMPTKNKHDAMKKQYHLDVTKSAIKRLK